MNKKDFEELLHIHNLIYVDGYERRLRERHKRQRQLGVVVPDFFKTPLWTLIAFNICLFSNLPGGYFLIYYAGWKILQACVQGYYHRRRKKYRAQLFLVRSILVKLFPEMEYMDINKYS